MADEEEGASGSRGSFYVFSGHGLGYVFASHGSRTLKLNCDRVGAGGLRHTLVCNSASSLLRYVFLVLDGNIVCEMLPAVW